jgi:hypothetical protein
MLDNLSAHISPESIELCIQKNIRPAYFPTHSTHFLQPADNLVIATFKKAIYAAIDIFKNRKLFDQLSANPLPIGYIKKER